MEYLEKGRQIAVEGRLHYSEWDNDGEKRSRHEVIAQQITFLSGKPADAEPAAVAASQEKIPRTRQKRRTRLLSGFARFRS